MTASRLAKEWKLWAGWLAVVLVAAGCATRPAVDWSSRVGIYTYDDAVIEYGPPDKIATLSDSSIVAEWILRRGGYQVHDYGIGGPWRPYRPGPWYGWGGGYVTALPDWSLRLVFDPDQRLKSWERIVR